jgi:predicted small integral membrane protein
MCHRAQFGYSAIKPFFLWPLPENRGRNSLLIRRLYPGQGGNMVKSHGAWQCWACPPLLLVHIRGAINKEGAIQQTSEIRALLSDAPRQYRALLALMEHWDYSTPDASPEFQAFHHWLVAETAVRDCLYVTAGVGLKKAFIELGWESQSPVARHYFTDVAGAVTFLDRQQITYPEQLAQLNSMAAS